tara:strand:- start:315 stop:1319 length:1005 start_codon:yes stop_codon:yes gene_type:complete
MSRKIKIVFYIHSPTTYQIDFFNELRKYYEVYIIYKYKFSNNHKLNFKIPNWMTFLNTKKTNTINKIIEKKKPNVVIIGGYKMDIQIKDKSIKKYFWLERLNNQNSALKIFLRKFYIKFKLSSAEGIFAIGNEAKKFYKKFNNNVFNIPYSIKTQKKIRKSINPKFLYVGQLIKRKGIDNLIKIIPNANNSNCSFTFVGNGPLKKKVLKLAKQEKNVFYHNFLNKNNLDKVYKKNNILILPSKYDGWGVVVIEAMARGMALISNKSVGAASEYIKHNFNGRLYNINNSTLESQIIFFQKNPNKINIFGNKNFILFQKNLCNTINAVRRVTKIIK